MSRFRRKNDRPRFKRNGKPLTDVDRIAGQPVLPHLPPPKVGRPTLYDPNVHPQFCYQACIVWGATNEMLAQAIHISPNTFNQWIDDRVELSQAIRKGRDKWDTEHVERTLLQRAMGYDFTEVRTKEILVSGVDAEGVAVAIPGQEVTTTKKFVPPNMTAIIFWLKNRQPERWRDVQAVDIKSEHKEVNVTRFEMLAGLKIEFDQLEVTELEQLLGHFRGDQPVIDVPSERSSSDVRPVDVG